MEILSIKIKDNQALKLIHDLEDFNLIQVVKSVVNNSAVNFYYLLMAVFPRGKSILCKRNCNKCVLNLS